MPEKPPRRITLRLSTTTAALVAAVAVLLAIATTTGSWIVARGALAFDDVHELKRQNEALAATNESLQARLWELQGQLVEYEQRTQELAAVAGVDLDGFTLGLGGESPASLSMDRQLGVLSRRSERLGSVLDDVEVRLFRTPSLFPTLGELTSRFGFRLDPLTGQRAFHRGIDIGTDPERAVYAAARGSVTLARRKGALGNAVHVAHDFGLTTRYGHLSRIVVESGQDVDRGDLLGFVGRTGRATGYHLHFEVLRDGRPVDPLRYLKGENVGP